LILITFFLPLSECHLFEKQLEEGDKILSVEVDKKVNKSDRYVIPCKMFKINDVSSWLLLLVFSWPILFTLIETIKYRKIKNGTIILSPLFCSITIFYIGQAFIVGDPLYGGYLWMASIVILTIISANEFIALVKKYTNRSDKIVDG